MSSVKPRVLFVARTRYRLPLDGNLKRKFDALGGKLTIRVLGTALPESPLGDSTFRLVPSRRPARLDGLLFYATLPAVVAGELRRFRPALVLTQSVYEAAAVQLAKAVTRSRARVVIDVHGDWATATELYGSPLRRVLRPVTTRVSRAALRRADAVRPVSEFTATLVRRQGIEPAATFMAYVDYTAFVATPTVPVPAVPRPLFVGVLERYKNVDGLAAAWRLAAPGVPDARLLIVGSGRERAVVDALVRDLPDQTEWILRLSQEEVARALDASTLLVLPSRSEGLPRIVVEAFCRARPVIGARAGGIPDIVEDGVNGLLVPPDDPAALAAALVRLLTDRELQLRLSEGARVSAAGWLQTPEEYAARVAALVADVAGT